MPDLLQTLRGTYAVNPAKALNMLPKICKAIDDGLIIEVPCKVGDTVFLKSRNDERFYLQPCEVVMLEVFESGVEIRIKYNNTVETVKQSQMVLTRDAAEKKLEGEKK